MKKEIKSGIIMAVSFLLTIGLVGITYAALSSLKVVDTDPLTATTWNNLVDHSVPSTAVMAFNSTSCPTGWSEYLPAQGRVIRGIDKTGTNIDPDGERSVGGVQEDAFQGHRHKVYYRMVGAAGSLVGDMNQQSPGTVTNTSSVREAISDGINGEPRITTETRSKNVALLYCVKD